MYLATSWKIWYSFFTRMRCFTVNFLFRNDKTFPHLYSHLKPFLDKKIFVIFNAFILFLLIYFLLYVSSHLKVNIWPKATQKKNFSIFCKMLWNVFSVDTNSFGSSEEKGKKGNQKRNNMMKNLCIERKSIFRLTCQIAVEVRNEKERKE